jgi:hypothetical protein
MKIESITSFVSWRNILQPEELSPPESDGGTAKQSLS